MLPLLAPLLVATLADSVCATPAERLTAPDGAPCVAAALAATRAVAPTVQDTTRPRRRHAVEYSDAYDTRLAIHRYASYTMLPLFVAQYVLGDRLLDQKDDAFAGRRSSPPSDGLRNAHVATAIGVGTLFGVNTVTGLWNLKESWKNPEGRGLRTTHALLMLAADAGFTATGIIGGDATDGTPADARRHRNVALSSMSVATVAAGLMWFAR
jgi:hypothetical protein